MPSKFNVLNSAIGQAKLASRVRSMLGVEEDPNVKVGINGFGRLGRMVCKIVQETAGIDVVAINDPHIDAEYMAYMLLHGKSNLAGPYSGEVLVENGQLMLDGRPVSVMAERSCNEINWVSAGAKYVVECSGHFDTLKKARGHLTGGAKRIVVAAPCVDAPTFVMGANHKAYNNEEVISGGSAAMHCLALLCRVVHEAEATGGIEHASASVMHASEPLELEQVLAGPSGAKAADWRSGRGEGIDIVPAASEAAQIVGKLLPDLEGRVHGSCYRLPAPTGGASVLDLTVKLRRPCEMDALLRAVRDAAETPALRGKLGYRDDAVDGGDFRADGRTCIVDAQASLALNDTFVKLIAWYNNEWAFCRRLVELLIHMQAVEFGVNPDALL